ncbi:MAG: hypothetical protein ACRDHW_15790, partial [Ktedonobacteraceae bacterium]
VSARFSNVLLFTTGTGIVVTSPPFLLLARFIPSHSLPALAVVARLFLEQLPFSSMYLTIHILDAKEFLDHYGKDITTTTIRARPLAALVAGL